MDVNHLRVGDIVRTSFAEECRIVQIVGGLGAVLDWLAADGSVWRQQEVEPLAELVLVRRAERGAA